MNIKLFKKKMIKDWRLNIEGYRSGQVAIIVLLISALLVSVGLSLSKKSTIETKIDINEEALKKAFNAAESGIDYYLATGGTTYETPDSLSSSKVDVRNIGVGNTINFGEYVVENGSEFYWLVNHDADGNLGSTYYPAGNVRVCGIGFTGSLEVNQFYFNGSDFGVKRYGFNFGTSSVNNFTNRSGQNCTSDIDTMGNTVLITVVPIFGGGSFYIQGGSNFPSQGDEITALGTAGGEVGVGNAVKINKKLVVSRRYKLPSFLLSGIVAETSVLSE